MTIMATITNVDIPFLFTEPPLHFFSTTSVWD
jgi:hypothetical protein